MRTLIINLAAETARMAFQRAQMDALGLDWERLEAVTPETLDPPAEDPRWQRWHRPMMPAEIAILSSHVMAWERVIDAGVPCLILEDDAMLAVEVPALLRRLESERGLDHVTLETRSRKKLMGRRHPGLPVRRLYQDRTGAAAYALWPSGARKLRSRAARRPALADAVICAAYEMRSWQADPALAIQLDQCSAYGMEPPIATRSSVDAKRPPRSSSLHHARRFAAHVRQGVRILSRIGVSERRRLAFSPCRPIPNTVRDA